MARFGLTRADRGRLETRRTERHAVGIIDGYFLPAMELRQKSSAATPARTEVKLLSLSPESSLPHIYPTNTLLDSERYLGPKYDQIRTLTIDLSGIGEYVDELELLLEDLPGGFIKDYAYGLGLLKDCNRLVSLIEDHTPCDEILFADSPHLGAEGAVFRLSLRIFGSIWSEIQRINSRGNRAAARVKDAFVHNSLAEILGLEQRTYSLGRHPLSHVIAKAASGAESLTEAEQDALIGSVSAESAALAQARPEKFLKLHREIELVSLDRLIREFEDALDKNQNEDYWQTFFDGNAFALQQVFGAPMVSVQSKATVGGGGFSGSGDKIADYLFKNSLTNNIALVEIKKPGTPLLNGREYRAGVFGASNELNAAVTQVLDQAYRLTSNLPVLKQSSRQWDLESYAVSCFVVAGRTPAIDEPDRQKSFELYRANSRSVTIVTYDEILERLKLLREFLSPQAKFSQSTEPLQG
jgi:hypothetical protein